MSHSDERIWYVLRSQKSSLHAAKSIEREIARRQAVQDTESPAPEYYVPKFVMAAKGGNKQEAVVKPLCLNYIFVRSTLSEALALRKSCPDLSLVKDGRADKDGTGYASLTDKTMRMFMVMVRAYKEKVPLCSPTPSELNAGDTVRVVGGSFSGVEGVLLTSRGYDGGTVVLRVTGTLLVPTLKVDARHLQVISFSEKSGHLYDRLDQYGKKIRKAMRSRLETGHIHERELDAVSEFAMRFGSTETPVGKMRARYDALLMMAHTILGNAEQAATYIYRCDSALKELPDDTSKLEIILSLFACTGKSKYEELACTSIGKWDSTTLKGKKRELADALTFYSGHRDSIGKAKDFTPAEMPKKPLYTHTAAIPEGHGGLVSFASGYISGLRDKGEVSVADRYAKTLNSFVKYLDGGDIAFPNFTNETVTGYRDWLIMKKLAGNTVAFYLRNLSILYNRAKARGLHTTDNPFAGIKTGHVVQKETGKRTLLTLDDLRRLRSLDLTAYHPSMSVACDLVLFSVYACGMTLIDILFLRRPALSGDTVTYTARATGKRHTVRWNSRLQDIADRYDPTTLSIFPYITTSDAAMAVRQYNAALHSINSSIKVLGNLLALPFPLTMTVVRHSWKNIMQSAAEEERIGAEMV